MSKNAQNLAFRKWIARTSRAMTTFLLVGPDERGDDEFREGGRGYEETQKIDAQLSCRSIGVHEAIVRARSGPPREHFDPAQARRARIGDNPGVHRESSS